MFNSDLLSELEHFRRHHCSWAETHRVGGRSGEGLARLSDVGQQDLHGWEAFQEVNVLPPMAREIAGKRGRTVLGEKGMKDRRWCQLLHCKMRL